MSEETTKQFLARLWSLQDADGLSNAELSRRIGCDASYIGHLRAGRKGKRVGLDFALGAARLYPELRGFFLPSELPVGNTVMLEGNETTVSEP